MKVKEGKALAIALVGNEEFADAVKRGGVKNAIAEILYFHMNNGEYHDQILEIFEEKNKA